MAQQSKVGRVATSVAKSGDDIVVTYHATEVVRANLRTRRVVLNNGGWFTSTTKTRMNQAASQFDLGFRVFQKNGEWFVTVGKREIPFDHSVCTFVAR